MHDLNLAAAYAHRVILMKDGRIEAAGTVDEVMTYRRLRAAFGVDIYVGLNELDQTRYFVPRRGRGVIGPG
jgi:iron complex transport system ATP-binding protein